MPVDANKPTDQALVSEWPSYVREGRTQMNTLEAGVIDLVFNDLTILAGDTALVVGSDLSISDFEFIKVSGTGTAAIDRIRGGSEGQVKTFIFQDNHISLVDGPKSDGCLYLNQLPVLSTFPAQQDDVITLINIGGEGGIEYGYWKELSRQLSVK